MTDADLVRRYLDLSSNGGTAAAALVADDVEIWLSGRLVVSGPLTLAQHRKAAAGVHDTFPGGYAMHVENVVAHDGHVAVEARGDGVLADGSRYTPSYAMFFRVADGLIRSIHEYIDTEYVGATFKLPVKRA